MAQDNGGVDYKKKYTELKARFIQSLDVSYRSGYEQGFNEAQNQAMAQQAEQQAQAMAQMQAAQQGQGQPGQGQPPQPGQEDPAQTGPQQPDELDQAIGQLEQLVSKSEISGDDLKKSLDEIRANHEHNKMLKKTQSIKTPLKVGFKLPPMQMSQSYKSNLPENSKAAVAMQSKIVDDILRKWEKEESKTSRDITQLLGTEALTKKEE